MNWAKGCTAVASVVFFALLLAAAAIAPGRRLNIVLLAALIMRYLFPLI